VIGLLILLAAQRLIGAPLPQRGAIYFIPVLSLTGLSCCQRFPRVVAARRPVVSSYMPPGFPTGAYLEGSETRGVARSPSVAYRRKAAGGSDRDRDRLEPVMNYYRSRYRPEGTGRASNERPPAWATTIMC